MPPAQIIVIYNIILFDIIFLDNLVERNDIMTDISIISCPKFLDNALTPVGKEIGNTLGNIFYLVFSPINYNVEKLKIKHAENLKQYEIEIRNELNKIPENKLVEPPLSIVGPALEASKFYIDEEILRKMFAKLIAASMNADIRSRAHHSFIEIIKQLSPLDASNLNIIFYKKHFPLARYDAVLNNDSGDWNTLETNVFLSNSQNKNIKEQAISIANLNRLGLVNISYENYITNKKLYSVFKKEPNYIAYVNDIKQKLNNNPKFSYKSIIIREGLVEITPLGLSFASTCM